LSQQLILQTPVDQFHCYGLIDWFLFHITLNNFLLLWRRQHCWWRAAKFRPMIGAQGFWAGRDFYRASPAVTRGLVFFRSYPKDRPIQSPLTTHEEMWKIYSNTDLHGSLLSRLSWHARRCWEPILAGRQQKA
jgi:hypothetical protein